MAQAVSQTDIGVALRWTEFLNSEVTGKWHSIYITLTDKSKR